MRDFASVLLGVILVTMTTSVNAFWRMTCGRIMTARIDPIISPGGISGHVHSLSGPINLNTTSTFDSLQASYCTSCGIQKDKSAYWTPQLYYRYRNGTFVDVPNGGIVVYYLDRGDPDVVAGMKPFPPGFRVLAGDSAARSYDTTTKTYCGNATNPLGCRLVADRTSFACLNYDNPNPETPSFNETYCPGGLRAQIQFPSCWDGVNLYKSDQSHMAYMSGIDTGRCPPNYPVLLPHLFFEMIYSINNVGQEPGGYFVFGNGDVTGYGFHGDFLNGWDVDAQAAAVKQCMGASATNNGGIANCPALNASLDPFADKNCPEQPPVVNEVVRGQLSALPGCNPPSGGPLRAVSNICPIVTSQVAVNNTDYFQRNYPEPGDMVGDFQYIGCALDTGSPKTLQGGFYQDGSALTVQSCTAYCRGLKYAYAGVSNGYQCYCGNAFENPIQSPGICAPLGGIVCDGNSQQYCGGQNVVGIYNDTKTTVAVKGLPIAGQTTFQVAGAPLATYAGCWSEASGGHALTSRSFTNQTGMTNELCALFCNTAGYTLFGTEYASECYCGNSIATSSVAQGNCTSICVGDNSEFCGSGGKLSLWTFNSTIPASSPTTSTTTGTAPVSTASATGFAYLGCMSDNGISGHALNSSFTTSTTQSIENCALQAQALNYQYFGLEYGSQCLIGYALSPLSVASNLCTSNPVKCTGNTAEVCGAGNAISFYNNTIASPRIPPRITVPGQATQFGYKGCYNDNAGARALGSTSSSTSYTISQTGLTIEQCAAICFNKGYSWMGVEYATQCYCNNAGVVNSQTVSANGDNDCVKPCDGNAQENCGAASKLEVYQVVTAGSRVVRGLK